MRHETIAAAVMASFVGEIEAFKPGNVSIYADGHDMTVQDFIKSAEVSVPILCDQKNSFGQRILNSVKATRKAVGCNTNLGMLLLFVPIIIAAENGAKTEEELRQILEITLSSLTKDDANLVFKAISLANPGGLGRVDSQDVNDAPDCSLLEAMQLACERDYIALQYTNNFEDIFGTGLVQIKSFVKRWNSVKWSAVACYLSWMSTIDDSHIQRKYGHQIAEQIKIKSKAVADKFFSSSNPEADIDLLKQFDEELKAKKYNPGTCADLTAASILVYNLTS